MNSTSKSLRSSLNGKDHHLEAMNRGGSVTLPRRILLNMDANAVRLKTCNNAWRPGLKKSGPIVNPEAQKTQELLKTVRAILNKITPEKFTRLMDQVQHLDITTEDQLKGVADLIFEKAIAEPSFAVIYSQMCYNLGTLTVPMKEDPNSYVKFSSLLVRRCREEFNQEKKLNSAASSTESRQLQEDLTLAQTTARKRSIGNIKFIGELFKQTMLAETVMLRCIEKLLNMADEESLECLCQLLSTIGMHIDTRKHKPKMEEYFTEIGSLIGNKRTSSRVKFLLQDIVDMRSNNWVLRRTDQGPKTIHEIHKEARMNERDSLKKVNRESQREQQMRKERQREVCEEREPKTRQHEERERQERERQEREQVAREREVRQREERERKTRQHEERQREERERQERDREEREKRVTAISEREERDREAFMRAEKVREAVERAHRQKRVGMRKVIERVERENKVRQQRVRELERETRG